MNKRLAILGASGHGKAIADAAQASQKWDEIEFFDDAPEMGNLRIFGEYPILGTSKNLLETMNKFSGVIIAIGNSSIRAEKVRLLKDHGANIVSISHPESIVSSQALIQPGTFIAPGAIINADTKIGEGCIINSGAIVEHDCQIENYTHICPGAQIGGNSNIGHHSWVGIGATVINNIEIKDHVIIGAGATVTKNVSSKLTVIGTPAKPK